MWMSVLRELITVIRYAQTLKDHLTAPVNLGLSSLQIAGAAVVGYSAIVLWGQ